MEIKLIEHTGNKYSVSNTGKIFSHVTKGGKIDLTQINERKAQISIWGYPVVDLLKHNKRVKYPIHRLVALAFIPNPLDKPCVNHLDGNKLNNHVDNLEWCTYSENEKHSHDVLGKKAPNCKPVEVYHKDGLFIGTFDSLNEACRYTGAQCSNAIKNIKGTRTHAANHVFKYVIGT
jgi:hypothetical protein